MHLNTVGLVIKENTTGENDRIVTLLTKESGVIRAFVRGAKNIRNNSMSATQLLGYSSFSIYRGKDAYIIDEAQPIEVFFNLRGDIERLSLAQYFCELACELAPQEMQAEEYLSLILNSLHLLSVSKRPQPFLKAVTELRILCLSGYMPNLVACEECGEFCDEYMFFNAREGVLHCKKCGGYGEKLGMGVVTAMRHICYSEPKKIYSFTLSDDSLSTLSRITEKYLMEQIQHRFKTLVFYKSIIGDMI